MKKLILVLCLICTPLYANERAVTVQSGWQHTASSAYGDGAVGAVRVEHPLVWDLSLGAEYSYHGQTFHEGYGAFKGHSLLGELIYYPKLGWKIQPFIFGGIGWSFWNFDRSKDLESRGIKVDLGDAQAEKVGVGFDYKLNDSWSLNVEWHYFHCAVPKNSYYEADGSPSNVVGNDDRSGRVTVGQEETNLMVGLKYAF